MKIAIFGDSFAVKSSDCQNIGWSSRLEECASVDNFSLSGISEYKILKLIKNINLSCYDKIIVVHTSPNRIYVPNNPLHKNSKSHSECDIIFSDIENRTDEFSRSCQLYFKHIFDLEYAKDIHNLLCREIFDITKLHNTLHLTFFDYSQLYNFDNKLVDLHTQWIKNKGSVNHHSAYGNQLIYTQLINLLEL